MDVHSPASIVDEVDDWLVISRIEIAEVLRAVQGRDAILLA